MNVLAISCHPDDMEINCAGTLLRCKKRGDNVTVCHVANGNMGHMVIEPDELTKTRIDEAKRSGEFAGFKVVTCNVGDLLVDDSDKEQIDSLVKVIRDAKPDFIITHAPNDYMNDHSAVSRLVFKASFSASVPHYEPQLGEATPTTPIYYMDNAALIDSEPEIYVDISNEFGTKYTMLNFHKSQLEWLGDHASSDVLDNIRIFSRVRGIQCGVKYAEGFRICRLHQKIKPGILLP